jgi:hypothetical protein
LVWEFVHCCVFCELTIPKNRMGLIIVTLTAQHTPTLSWLSPNVLVWNCLLSAICYLALSVSVTSSIKSVRQWLNHRTLFHETNYWTTFWHIFVYVFLNLVQYYVSSVKLLVCSGVFSIKDLFEICSVVEVPLILKELKHWETSF